MTRRKNKGKKITIAVLVLMIILLLAANLMLEQITFTASYPLLGESKKIETGGGEGTQIIVEGGFPTGKAVRPQGGAQLQQPNQINVNNISYGQVFSLDGSNVTNTTISNYTFVSSNECGDKCIPSQGNCTLVNVSLIKISTGALIQNRTICTGQGYPVDQPGGEYFYNYFRTVLTTEPGEPESSYTVNVTAQNGTYQGKNSSVGARFVYINVYFTQGLEGVPPQWSDNQSSTPTNYDPGFVSNFTIRWVDNNEMDTALFESNFSGSAQNYTMSNFTPTGYYQYINVLPAGTFYWKSYANDTEPNWNVSDTWYFTISKSNQNIVDLWINGNKNQNVTITYGTQSNATADAPAGPTLYRNGTFIGTSEVATLSAGLYEYKANATGNANYSANSTGVISFLNITQATPSLTITFSPSSSETYGTTTTATCTISSGDPGATLVLYRNGTQVNSSTDEVTETNILGAGVYNYTCVYQSTQNYTDGASLDNYLTINKSSMPITLLLNGTDADRSYVKNTNANFTAFTSISGLTIGLYTNFSDGVNKLWDSGPSPLINITNMTTIGTWNFTAHFAGNQNYTENSSTRYVTITKNPTTMKLFFNGTEGNVTYEPGTVVNITAELNVSGKTIYLDINITNWTTISGITPLQNITQFSDEGYYNVTAWFPGDADYEASTITYFVTIQAAAPPPAPPVGPGAAAPVAPAAPAPPAPKPEYTASMTKYSYDLGDTVGLKYKIFNPKRTDIVAKVRTTIAKEGEVVWTDERDISVSANTTREWTIDAFTVECQTPFGHYAVDVAFIVNKTVVESVPLSFNVISKCKAAEISVSPDKFSYFTNETAKITVIVENTGNVLLKNAKVVELLTGPNRSEEFTRTITLEPGEKNTNVNEISLADFKSGSYTYEAKIIYEGETLDSDSASFIVIVPVVVVYFLPLLLGLGALFIVLWKVRKPLTVKKKKTLLLKKTKVEFELNNRTKHVYKNVIILDRVPPKIPIKNMRPLPVKKRSTPKGIILEWRIKRVMPKEKRRFRYVLEKRKRWLPRVKIKKYERDKVYEEKLKKAKKSKRKAR